MCIFCSAFKRSIACRNRKQITPLIVPRYEKQPAGVYRSYEALPRIPFTGIKVTPVPRKNQRVPLQQWRENPPSHYASKSPASMVSIEPTQAPRNPQKQVRFLLYPKKDHVYSDQGRGISFPLVDTNLRDAALWREGVRHRKAVEEARLLGAYVPYPSTSGEQRRRR